MELTKVHRNDLFSLTTKNHQTPLKTSTKMEVDGRRVYPILEDNVVKITMQPKQNCRSNAIPIKIQQSSVLFCFAELGRMILNFIWKCKGSRIVKTSLQIRKKYVGEYTIQNLLQRPEMLLTKMLTQAPQIIRTYYQKKKKKRKML